MILLVFEADFTDLCIEIRILHCQPEQQFEGVQTRNRPYEAEAPVRMDAQGTMERKGKPTDQLIDNSIDVKQCKEYVQRLL